MLWFNKSRSEFIQLMSAICWETDLLITQIPFHLLFFQRAFKPEGLTVIFHDFGHTHDWFRLIIDTNREFSTETKYEYVYIYI